MKKEPHEKYMSLAISLAKKGEGMTSPNPLVGAVLVKRGKIIGKGYHRKAGLPHAEIEAFIDAGRKGQDVGGSTLYVSLEPCCHREKKTPPCTDAVIEKGVGEVIVGALDPNPRVSGKGVKTLKLAGIRVTTGVLEEKACELNEAFNKYITTGTPFVTLKLAATLDGKIATHTGDSKWIGSERQRKMGHRLRNLADAVMVGTGTVLKDDPSLNVRLYKNAGRQPVPVVLDRTLKTPVKSKIFSAHDSVIIVTGKSHDRVKSKKLEGAGARIIEVGLGRDGHLGLIELVRELGKNEITSLLIEGGSATAALALKSGIVDKVVFFYAPRVIGAEGLSMIGKLGVSRIKDSLGIERVKIRKFGDEIMVEGYVAK
ncbi:MAG: riboflavin biosynthesis protein RibD [Candidatus Dadabacteria bacterium RIFCSPHIGHO2_12_FULL_53_21]|jgi:diaminohydroxyphosphoribosylaminopyrimidine deaminase/5-amino-6-(5-phosphoribosylamino)uracil reductase|nr:MAG: riboflavin biosynthesis protein RibD [Candidatus Dadabacteria bacterium RIFCSPHIGHO2_12_FULL_53_21]